MTSITLEIPDAIFESHHQDLRDIAKEVQQGFIIWEYINGHISIKQSAEMLKLSYRAFLELLLTRGISIDALSNDELAQQCANLNRLIN